MRAFTSCTPQVACVKLVASAWQVAADTAQHAEAIGVADASGCQAPHVKWYDLCKPWQDLGTQDEMAAEATEACTAAPIVLQLQRRRSAMPRARALVDADSAAGWQPAAPR